MFTKELKDMKNEKDKPDKDKEVMPLLHLEKMRDIYIIPGSFSQVGEKYQK